jgi:hypothetical protein
MLARQRFEILLPPGAPPTEISQAELKFGVAADLVAHSGGGQTSGKLITTSLSEFTSVAADNDSATLPPSTAGTMLVVVNASTQAKTLAVFPATGEKINGGTPDEAFAVASGLRALFFSLKQGNWYTLVTA